MKATSDFPSTRWSFVLKRPTDVEERKRTAEELCRLYWQPVYAFVRGSLLADSRGAGHQRAEDLTQGFFASAIESGLFEDADPEKGRLRSYVLGAVKNYVAAEHRHASVEKRGGGMHFVYIDAGREERTRYSGAVAIQEEGLPPDQLFDRRWAEGLLETGLQQLREEYEARNKRAVYEALKPLLAADSNDSELLQEQAKVSLRCGAGALRVALYRFRKRYRELVREEVLSTLLEGDEIEDEVAWLARVLAAKL